jgi:cellulose synthase/poly-beta-1,6-N-acetylglucosamine synthase-like glycosyltransferase/DNA-binding response OmpR family regulator
VKEGRVAAAGASAGAAGNVLLLEDDPDLAELVQLVLEDAGYTVTHAEDGAKGWEQLGKLLPDVIVSDVMMPNVDGLQFLERVRGDATLRRIPVLLLTTKSRLEDIVAGFDIGADDYVLKPFQPNELVARVRSKMMRPPVPVEEIRHDRATGLLTESAFLSEIERERMRAKRGSYPGVVASLVLHERRRLIDRFGPTVDNALTHQVARALAGCFDGLASFARGRDGNVLLLLPGLAPADARVLLADAAQRVSAGRFEVQGELVRVTPSLGFVSFDRTERPNELRRLAALAADHAGSHLDLQPAEFTPAMEAAAQERRRRAPRLRAVLEAWRLTLQIAATFIAATCIPFAIYWACGAAGFDISWYVYVAMVIMITATALLIWIEGVLALRRIDPPRAESYPPASAVIAAYLPNEAATLESTIEAFLRVDYPSPIQIILAYNTPKPMPFEAVLQEIAAREPRFVPLKVEGSTSKAQNVNAALSHVTGEFTAVFDADHQPDPDSFRRAWDWIADGADIVQGHCSIRNGDASWVARMVAIEFEQIYAVSHPGRARLHAFGIFGGSNGYWRTELLRSIRMHGFMLTEDIDSALRVVENGGKIVSDPHLISRELAPTDLKSLTNQRLRWAQGWFQVSLKRFWPLLRSPHLTLRQKLGAFHLLAWREVFPWISLQIFPIVTYWAWQAGGLHRLNWFVPILFVLTIATLATGPGQILFTYILADRAHRRNRHWFLTYLASSFFFYSEYKNILARVAQLKEFMGERAWKVTPRASTP